MSWHLEGADGRRVLLTTRWRFPDLASTHVSVGIWPGLSRNLVA